MVVEYCKYLVILTRESILGLGPKDKPASLPASASPSSTQAPSRP
jgi:hypothetical protein